MAVKVKVEKTEDGIYWGTTQNIPGVVTADGSNLEDLKNNLKEALEIYIETAEEHAKEIYAELSKGFELEFEIELSQVFKKFEVLNKSEFAKLIGINPALMRKYTSDKGTYISEKRAKEIEQGLHRLGEELLSVKI